MRFKERLKPKSNKPLIRGFRPLIFFQKCDCCKCKILFEEMWEISCIPNAKPLNIAYYIVFISFLIKCWIQNEEETICTAQTYIG